MPNHSFAYTMVCMPAWKEGNFCQSGVMGAKARESEASVSQLTGINSISAERKSIIVRGKCQEEVTTKTFLHFRSARICIVRSAFSAVSRAFSSHKIAEAGTPKVSSSGFSES